MFPHGFWPKVQSSYLVWPTMDVGKTAVSNGMEVYKIWQYGLWRFQTGDTKLERFLPKNQHTERKSLKFEFGLTVSCQKVPKFEFQGQFSLSKII